MLLRVLTKIFISVDRIDLSEQDRKILELAGDRWGGPLDFIESDELGRSAESGHVPVRICGQGSFVVSVVQPCMDVCTGVEHRTDDDR